MARGRFTFWLDYGKDDELLLAETIDHLKAKRLFAKTIRDGIRLICDLRRGRVDVLFELFPWVKAEFLAGVQPVETPAEQAIREQLARIERQLITSGGAVSHQAFGIPQLSGFDGRDYEASSTENDVSSSHNFSSMMPLQKINNLSSPFVKTDDAGASAQKIRENFSTGMGDLFADDDDVWD